MGSKSFISFPAGVVCRGPLRLGLLQAGEGWLVLEKPGWLGAVPDAWQPGQFSLQEALQTGIRRGKPELLKLGMTGATLLPPLEAGCGGPVLVAGTRELAIRFREAWGCDQWGLRFIFLAENLRQEDPPVRECDLPVARHFNEIRAVVSHRTGKKAHTTFRRLAGGGRLQLWEGVTRFIRPHQIRLHAAEVGLRIAGESIYSECAPVSTTDLRAGRADHDGRVLHPGPALFLESLRFRGGVSGEDGQPARIAPPKSFHRWLRAHGLEIPGWNGA